MRRPVRERFSLSRMKRSNVRAAKRSIDTRGRTSTYRRARSRRRIKGAAIDTAGGYNPNMQSPMHQYRQQFQPSPWAPLFWTVLAGVALYALADDRKPKRRCSVCDRKNHDARNCPFIGKRQTLRIKKTGVCRCCGRRPRKTVGHHYGGRGDGSKGKEMCIPCHQHCGHDGNHRKFAINPRVCRLIFS